MVIKETAAHECRDRAQKRTATFEHPYHFVGSGLPNVYLAGIDYYVCGECGKQAADIPALNELMVKIARTVVQKEPALTGDEIRFLRKRLRKKSNEFAKIIGVTAEQASRWENGDNPPAPSADKLIRLFYCILSEDDDLREFLGTNLAEWLSAIPGVEHIKSFRAQLRDHEWTAESVLA